MGGLGTNVLGMNWYSVYELSASALRYMWVMIKAQVPTEDGYYMCLTDANITHPDTSFNHSLELDNCGLASSHGDGREVWLFTHDRFQNYTRSHSIAHNW